MEYKTFKIRIEGIDDCVEVVAVDFKSAWADICEAYYEPKLLQWGMK